MEIMMKHLGEIITGNTPSKKNEEFWNSGDICFVKPDIISDNGVNQIFESNEYISERARKKARIVSKDSIFVTCIGSIGKIGIALEGEYAFNQQINVIVPNDKVVPKYLAYNLLYNKPRLALTANAPVVPIINKSQFGDFTINIDSDKNKQSEIAYVLDKLTHIIKLRNDELSALDDLIKARFVEMFGDRYVNDKKWNTTKLGESISFNNGKAHEQVVDENGDYILVTSRAIASDFEDVRRTNTLLFPLHKNDIVMVMSDVPNGKALAKCQLIDSDDKYTLNQRICSFDNYEYNTIFLLHLLNRHPYFLSFNDGNGQTNLRKNDILECELIVPPFELQNQFADCVKQVNKFEF